MIIKNSALDTILARRSTRSYTDEPVTEDELDTLLEAAVWAPSGSNSQSWLFTAIQNKDVFRRLNAAIAEAGKTYVPDDDYPGKHRVRERTAMENYHVCYGAPMLIIASNKPGYENAMADCALALENIFLTAEALGLGSCYINILHWLQRDPQLREFLAETGIPREHVICSSVCVGHIKNASQPPARKPGTIKKVL